MPSPGRNPFVALALAAGVAACAGEPPPLNRAPAPKAVPDVTLAEGVPQTIALQATDPDGDAVTFALIGAPAFARLEGPNLTLSPSFTDAGSYEFAVLVRDAKALSAQTSVKVTVAEVDREPKLVVPAELDVREGERRILVLDATDPDGTPLELKLDAEAPKWATTAGTALVLFPQVGDAGATLKLTLTSGGKSVEQSVKVTVKLGTHETGANHAPTIELAATAEVKEGEQTSLAVTGTDVDGDPLTISFDAACAFCTVTATGIDLLPPFDAFERLAPSHAFTFRATVTDPGGLSATAAVAVTVVNTDRWPEMRGPQSFSLAENTVQSFLLDAGDPDGDALEVSIAGVLVNMNGDNPHLEPAPEWVSVDGRLVTLRPPLGAAGSFPLQFAVRAGGKLAEAGLVNVTVVAGRPDNYPPVIAPIVDLVVEENKGLAYPLDVTDQDGEETEAAVINGPTWATVEGKTLNLGPGYFDAGVYEMDLVARDARGLTGVGHVKVTVTNVDRLPTLLPLGPITMSEAQGKVVPLYAFDPDHDPIEFTLASDAPAWAQLSGSALVLTPDYGAATSTTLRISAKAGGIEVVQPLEVTVTKANRPPVFTSGEAFVEVTAGTSKSVAFPAQDPDSGDRVSLTLESAPTWARLETSNSSLVLTPPLTAFGDSRFVVVATDAAGATARYPVLVRVNRSTSAPSLASVELVGATGGLLTLTTDRGFEVDVGYSDVENDPVSVELEVRRDSEPFQNAATVRSPFETTSPRRVGVTLARIGGYKVQARVVDSTGLASPWLDTGGGQAVVQLSPAFDVTVTLASSAVRTPFVEATFAPRGFFVAPLRVEATDGSTVAFAADLSTAPAVLALDPGVEGQHTLHVVVSDALGSQAEATLKVLYDRTAPSILADQVDPWATPVFFLPGQARPPRLGWTRAGAVVLAHTVIESQGALRRVCFTRTPESPFSAECLEGAAYAPGTFDADDAGSDGAWTYWVVATDVAGNESRFPVWVRRDTEAPTVSTFDLPTGPTNAAAAAAWITATDASPGVEICDPTQAAMGDPCDRFVTGTAFQREYTLCKSDGNCSLSESIYDDAGNVASASDTIAIDRAVPSVTLAPDPAGGRTVSSTFYVANAPFPASLTLGADSADVTRMQFQVDSGAWSDAEAFSKTKAVSLSGEGLRTVAARVADAAGNWSAPSSVQFVRDTAAPTITNRSLAINGGNAYTSNASVTLTFADVVDQPWGAVEQVEVYRSPATSGPLVPFASPLTFGIGSATNGATVALNARFYDRAGNASAAATASIIYDTTTISVTVSLPKYTTGNAVTLGYAVPSAPTGLVITGVCAKNESGTQICGLPVPSASNGYAVTYAGWNLSAGQGTRSVEVSLTRASGNNPTGLATTLVDGLAPTVQSLTLNGTTSAATLQTAYTRLTNPPVTLRLAAETDTAPVTQYCTALDTTCTPATDLPAANGDGSYTLAPGVGTSDGSRKLVVMVKDAAGNVSSGTAVPATLQVLKDTVQPTVGTPSFQNLSNATLAVTKTTPVVVRLTTPADAGSGLESVTFTDSRDGVVSTFTTFTSPYDYNAAVGTADGTRTFAIVVRDRAGNTTSATTTLVGVDRAMPSGTFTGDANLLLVGSMLWSKAASFTATYASSNGATRVCRQASTTPPTSFAGCLTLAGSPTATATESVTLPTGTTASLQNVLFFVDDAFNVASAVPMTVSVDRQGPTLGSSSTTWRNHESTITWTAATEATSNVGLATLPYQITWRYSGGQTFTEPWTSATTETIGPTMNDRLYGYTLTAIDLLGNTTSLSATETNTGHNWQYFERRPVSGDLTDVAAPSTTTWVAAGTNGVALRSLDGGVTWTRQDLGADVHWRAVAFNGVRGLIVGDNAMASYSTDSGATWTVAAPLPSGVSTGNLLQVKYLHTNTAVSPAQDVFVAGDNNGTLLIGRMNTSTGAVSWTRGAANMGAVWSMVTLPPNATYAYGVVIVASSNAVYRSVDGGATVTLSTSSGYNGLTVLPGTRYVVRSSYGIGAPNAGTSGYVSMSLNDAVSWATMASSLTTYAPPSWWSPQVMPIVGLTATSFAFLTRSSTAENADMSFVRYLCTIGTTASCTGTTTVLTGSGGFATRGLVQGGTGVIVGRMGLVYSSASVDAAANWTNRSTGLTKHFLGGGRRGAYLWVTGEGGRTVVYNATTGALVAAVTPSEANLVLTGLTFWDDNTAYAAGYTGTSTFASRVYRFVLSGTTLTATNMSGTTSGSLGTQANRLYAISCARPASGTGGFCTAVGENSTVAAWDGVASTFSWQGSAPGRIYRGAWAAYDASNNRLAYAVGEDTTAAKAITATGTYTTSLSLTNVQPVEITSPRLFSVAQASSTSWVATATSGQVYTASSFAGPWTVRLVAAGGGNMLVAAPLAGSGTTYLVGGEGGMLVESTNSGASWTRYSTPVPSPITVVGQTGTAGSSIVWAGGYEGALFAGERQRQ